LACEIKRTLCGQSRQIIFDKNPLWLDRIFFKILMMMMMMIMMMTMKMMTIMMMVIVTTDVRWENVFLY
jgi:hypothetical protein